MVIDRHVFRCAMTLRPHGTAAPRCRVDLDGETWFDGEIAESVTVEIHVMLESGAHDLTITYRSKAQDDADQAIKIQEINFNGVVDQRFIWHGIYRPDYPEPWASQQRRRGIVMPDKLINTDYLGWNGIWNLRFSSPVFTWIHEVQGLGWIYD